MVKALTENQYERLVKDLKKIVEAGKLRGRQAVNRELVRTYWEVGQRLHRTKLENKHWYGQAVVENLSEALDLHVDVLRKSVLFYERYQKQFPWELNISWSHYRILAFLPDDRERAFYQKQILKENWSRRDLEQAIQKGSYHQQKLSGKKKRKIRKLSRPKEMTYVYKAQMDRVVDGDTLLLKIDLGFEVWKEQRIRLANVDAEPKKTAEGKQAMRKIQQQLAEAPFILVKTNQVDIHARYVAHVFYSFEEGSIDGVFQKGRYLNQDLLDWGLAE